MKILKVEDGFLHWCPGCQSLHSIPTVNPGGDVWKFDDNMAQPSFTPSVRITSRSSICHYYIKLGKIEYELDTTHYLRGRSLELEDRWNADGTPAS